MTDLIAILRLTKKPSSKLEYAGPCPRCGGKDRFILWPEEGRFWCRNENCHLAGSLSYLEYWLSKHGYNVTVEKYRNDVPRQPIKPPQFRDYIEEELISECKARNPDRVRQYYGGFGLSDESIYHWKIGYWSRGAWRGFLLPYELWDSETHAWLMGAEIRADVANMPRFQSVKGSKNSGFSNNKLISIPGIREGKPLDYLFITESKKDAYLLGDLGYNASAFKPDRYWLLNLDDCLAKVTLPIIVQDNDGGRGRERAQVIENYCTKNTLRISTVEYKQPSDLAQAKGRDAVKQWIDEALPWL